MLLDDIAEWAGSEVGVEAALDEEGQDIWGGGEVDSFLGEESEFGGEHGLGDFELHFVGEVVEDELFGDAGEEFGAECARGATEDVALHCGEWGVLELHHFGGTEVGREDDIEVGEVQCFACRDGDAGGVEDLQEDVENSRVGLFAFIEKDGTFAQVLHGLAERSFFALFSAEEDGEAVLRLIFRHVEAEQVFRAEKAACECEGEFRFSDTGGAEEKKTATRAIAFCEAEFAPLEDGCNSRDDVILSADDTAEMRFEGVELRDQFGRNFV